MRWFLAEFSCLGVKVNVSPQATCQFSGVNAPVIGVAKMKLSIDILAQCDNKEVLPVQLCEGFECETNRIFGTGKTNVAQKW